MHGLSLSLTRLRLAYGRRTVLADVDLEIAAGERICLGGPNGAGKSSLLRCLTGLAPTAPGMVRIDGVPLAELSRERLARTVAVVPGQVALPFAMRVEEVVALGRIPHEHRLSGPRLADLAAVDAAMERAGI